MAQVTPIRDLKGYLEPVQVERLIAAAKNPRDKAFVSVLAKGGIRISEAIQLKEGDIDFNRGTLTIMHLKERLKLKCPNCGEVLGKRHLFCPGCGNKVSEAIQLKEGDIDFNRGTLTIMHLKERLKLKCPNCGEVLGKRHLFCPGCGNKVSEAMREKVEQRRQRVIPIDRDTLRLLDEYLKWRRKFPYKGPLVFPFSRQRGWQLAEKIGRRAGIKGLHPHSLRHLLATTWVSKGLDVKKLQVLLGHASIATTMEYVDSNFEQLRAEYNRLWEIKEDETAETES